MLSLDNTYSEEEVADFFRRLERLIPGETIDAVIEPKVDGVALSILYRDGVLEYAATRGNGISGDDVTAKYSDHPGCTDALAGLRAGRD